MRQKFLVITHLFLTVLAYLSWLWLDWRILAVLAVAHLILLEIAGGCPLAHAQFPEDKNKRFYEWWMSKLGVKFTKRNRQPIFIFMRYVMPIVIIGLAILLQIGLNFQPLVRLFS